MLLGRKVLRGSSLITLTLSTHTHTLYLSISLSLFLSLLSTLCSLLSTLYSLLSLSTLTPAYSEGSQRPQPLLVSKKVLQYTSNLYGSTPPICIVVPSLKEQAKNPASPSHLHCSTPPICMTFTFHLYNNTFEKALGVGVTGKFLTIPFREIIAEGVLRPFFLSYVVLRLHFSLAMWSCASIAETPLLPRGLATRVCVCVCVCVCVWGGGVRGIAPSLFLVRDINPIPRNMRYRRDSLAVAHNTMSPEISQQFRNRSFV